MEFAGLLITTGCVFYAWVFLLRWRRSGAAAGRPVPLGGEASPLAAQSSHPQAKFVLFFVLPLVMLAIVLAALVVGSGLLIRPACTTGVVITEGPHGEKIECVCVGGVQAACFEPGP